jgi:hypothetical protein
MIPSNYNSTKLCFVYFAFSRGSVPGKRNAWFILYQELREGGKPNLRDPASRTKSQDHGWSSITLPIERGLAKNRSTSSL